MSWPRHWYGRKEGECLYCWAINTETDLRQLDHTALSYTRRKQSEELHICNPHEPELAAALLRAND